MANSSISERMQKLAALKKKKTGQNVAVSAPSREAEPVTAPTAVAEEPIRAEAGQDSLSAYFEALGIGVSEPDLANMTRPAAPQMVEASPEPQPEPQPEPELVAEPAPEPEPEEGGTLSSLEDTTEQMAGPEVETPAAEDMFAAEAHEDDERAPKPEAAVEDSDDAALNDLAALADDDDIADLPPVEDATAMEPGGEAQDAEPDDIADVTGEADSLDVLEPQTPADEDTEPTLLTGDEAPDEPSDESQESADIVEEEDLAASFEAEFGVASDDDVSAEPGSEPQANTDGHAIRFDAGRTDLIRQLATQHGCSEDDIVLTAIDWYLDAMFAEEGEQQAG